MMGPPTYPEISVPTWAEYCDDYVEYFFDGSHPERGRSFIIEHDGEAVGHISYSQTDLARSWTEIDLWMRSSADCGKGIGSAGLQELCRLLHESLGLRHFLIRPSRRNPRAIHAYAKAGFVAGVLSEKEMMHFGPGEFHDTVIMWLRLDKPH